MSIGFWFLLLYFLILLLQWRLLQFRSTRHLEHRQAQNTLSPSPKQDYSPLLPSVSVIICAKNEADNLNKHLPFILRQVYPADKWEIIVVDDASTDHTVTVLKQFPQLKVITIDADTHRTLPGKKQALHQGILAASFDWVLLTDADCRPVSDYWIASFAQNYIRNKRPILLGYGGYEEKKGGLNKIVQWETVQTCIQYAGMALAGLPYMGVGRNLMYAKQLYLRALQEETFFSVYASIPSGDDDLLIGKIATADNTGLCLTPTAHTVSAPPVHFRQWLHQKRRHVSSGKYYAPRVKAILGISALSLGLFWLLWLIAFLLFFLSLTGWGANLNTYLLGICVFLGFIRMALYRRNAEKWYRLLQCRRFIRFYLSGELIFSVIYLLLSPYIFLKNKKQWN